MKNLRVITFVSAGKFSRVYENNKLADNLKRSFEHHNLLIEDNQTSIEELAMFTNMRECDVKELIENVIVAKKFLAIARNDQTPN